MAQQQHTTNIYSLPIKFSIYHLEKFWASWNALRIPNTHANECVQNHSWYLLFLSNRAQYHNTYMEY